MNPWWLILGGFSLILAAPDYTIAWEWKGLNYYLGNVVSRSEEICRRVAHQHCDNLGMCQHWNHAGDCGDFDRQPWDLCYGITWELCCKQEKKADPSKGERPCYSP